MGPPKSSDSDLQAKRYNSTIANTLWRAIILMIWLAGSHRPGGEGELRYMGLYN